MIRIICTECKNAYLRDEGKKLVCPSCEATYTEDKKNLLLGIQYYKEENYSEADNCFMKYIVKNGTEPIAIFYKAFCDAQNLDEDTLSLNDTYKKLLNAFVDATDEDFPVLIGLANDEAEKLEKTLTEIHVRLFADADAEKIKKQVETILNIQKEAKDFRNALAALVFTFNERSPRKLSVRYSDCCYVESQIAAEVGDIKYQKICDNIASHTVFTGILTNDIKNLEIYLRCIVMFFQKSHDKYEFLLEQSNKFVNIAEILELGRYNTIKGTAAVADKLKAVSYEFLQDSYKEHFDEQIDMQTETVVVLEPEIIEEEDISTEEIIQETETVQAETTEEEETAEESSQKAEEVEENISEEIVEETTVEETASESLEEDIETDTAIIEIEVEEVIEETTETEIEDISSSTTEIIDKAPQEEPEEIEESQYEAIIELPVNATEESTSEPDETSGEATEENAEETPEESSEKEPVEAETVIDNFEKVEADEAVINGDDQKHKRVNPKKKKGHKALVLVILLAVLAGLLAGYKYVPGYINDYKYDKAATLAKEGNYSDAITAFKALGDYSDSAQKATECEYNYALQLEEAGKFAEAKMIYENLGDHADSKTRVQACAYSEAKQALEKNNFEKAAKLFVALGDYGDSKEMIKECSYKQALSLIENKEYKSAIEILTTIRKYADSKDKILEAKYMYVTDNFDKKDKRTVKYLNELTTAKFRNSADLRKELLGSSDVLSDNIKAVVNYSSTDIETSLTELDNTRPIYFHAVVGDKTLYGKTLTIKYTTAFGYTQRKNVVLSESDNVAVMSYPATQYKNYTVEFELLDSNGQKLAGQKISF